MVKQGRKELTLKFGMLFCVLLSVLSGTAYSSSSHELVKQGNSLFRRRNYNDALRKYEAALIKSPDSASIAYNIGLTYQAMQKHLEALIAFERAELRVPLRSSKGISIEQIRYRIGYQYWKLAEKQTSRLRQLELLDQAKNYNRLVIRDLKEEKGLKTNARRAFGLAQLKMTEVRKRLRDRDIDEEIPVRKHSSDSFSHAFPGQFSDHVLQTPIEKQPRLLQLLSTGDRLDRIEDHVNQLKFLLSNEREAKKLDVTKLNELTRGTNHYLEELESIARQEHFDGYSPDATRASWLFLNLVLQRGTLLLRLADKHALKGQWQVAQYNQDQTLNDYRTLSKLLKKKLFHRGTGGIGSQYSSLARVFRNSFLLEIRKPYRSAKAPKSLDEAKAMISSTFNRFAGTKRTTSSSLPDSAIRHGIRVWRGDYRSETQKREQAIFDRRKPVVLRTDDQVRLAHNDQSKHYGWRIAVDAIRALSEIEDNLSRVSQYTVAPFSFQEVKDDVLKAEIQEFINGLDYQKRAREILKAISQSDLEHTYFDTFAKAKITPWKKTLDLKKKFQKAKNKNKQARKADTKKRQRSEEADLLRNKKELIKIIKQLISSIDPEHIPNHRQDLVRFLLAEIESRLNETDPPTLLGIYKYLKGEKVQIPKLVEYLDGMKVEFPKLAQDPKIKSEPLFTLIFMTQRPEDFRLKSIKQLKWFDNTVLHERFEAQNGPKTKDAWEEMKATFLANRIPTHTLSNYKETKKLIKTLIKAREIHQNTDPEKRPKKLRDLELEDDNIRISTELSAGTKKRKLGVLSDEEKDKNINGKAKVLAVYYPRSNWPLFPKEMGYKVGQFYVTDDPTGAPHDPPVTEVLDKTQTIWIRQGRSHNGHLKVPTGSVIKSVVVGGRDKTSEVKREPRGNLYFLEDAKTKEVEITVYKNGRPKKEAISTADQAIRNYYLKPEPNIKVNYPPDLKKKIEDIKKKLKDPGLMSKGSAQMSAARHIVRWISQNIYYSQSRETHDQYEEFIRKAKRDPKLNVLNFMLECKKGDCDVHNALLAYILINEFGIPVRQPGGLRGKRGVVHRNPVHGWSEIWIPEKGGWVTIDATSSKRERGYSDFVFSSRPFKGKKIKELHPTIQQKIMMFRCLKEYVDSLATVRGDITILEDNDIDFKAVFREYCPETGLHSLSKGRIARVLNDTFSIFVNLKNLANDIDKSFFLDADWTRDQQRLEYASSGANADLVMFVLSKLGSPEVDPLRTDVSRLLDHLQRIIYRIGYQKPLVAQFFKVLPRMVRIDKVNRGVVKAWITSFDNVAANQVSDIQATQEDVWEGSIPTIKAFREKQLKKLLDEKDIDSQKLPEDERFWTGFLYHQHYISPDVDKDVPSLLKVGDEAEDALLDVFQHAKLARKKGQIDQSAINLIAHGALPRTFRHDKKDPPTVQPDINYSRFNPNLSGAVARIFYDDIIREIHDTGEFHEKWLLLDENLPDKFSLDVINAFVTAKPRSRLRIKAKSRNHVFAEKGVFVSPGLKKFLDRFLSKLSTAEITYLLEQLSTRIETFPEEVRQSPPGTATRDLIEKLLNDRLVLQKILSQELLERDIPLPEELTLTLKSLVRSTLSEPQVADHDRSAASVEAYSPPPVKGGRINTIEYEDRSRANPALVSDLANHLLDREGTFARFWPKKGHVIEWIIGTHVDQYAVHRSVLKLGISPRDAYARMHSYRDPYSMTPEQRTQEFYNLLATFSQSTPTFESWRTKRNSDRISEADLLFDQLPEIEDEKTVHLVLKRALNSQLFLKNPRGFIQRFLSLIELTGDNKFESAIPLIFEATENLHLSHQEFLKHRRNKIPRDAEAKVEFFARELGIDSQKHSVLGIGRLLRKLENELDIRFGGINTSSRLSIINRKLEDLLKDNRAQLKASLSAQNHAPGESILYQMELADLLYLTKPEVRKDLLSKYGEKRPMFGGISDAIDRHEDYVAPLIERKIDPTLRRVTRNYHADRKVATNPKQFDRNVSPLIEGRLNLLNRKKKANQDFFDVVDVAHSILVDRSKEELQKLGNQQIPHLDDSPVTLGKNVLKGLMVIFTDTAKKNAGKIVPIFAKQQSGQLKPFELPKKTKETLDVFYEWLSRVSDQKVVDSLIRETVLNVAKGIKSLKSTSANRKLVNEVITGAKKLLSRASVRERKTLAITFFKSIYVEGNEEMMDYFYEEIIISILKSSKQKEAKFLITAFWTDEKRIADDNVFKFVLRSTLDQDTYRKLSDETVEGERVSELQVAALQSLTHLMRVSGVQRRLSELSIKFQKLRPGPKRSGWSMNRLYRFLGGEVKPTLPDRDLSLVVLNHIDGKVFPQNKFLKRSIPPLTEAERMRVAVQSAATGLISAGLIPHFVDRDRFTKEQGVLNKAKLESELVLAVGVTSMLRADGRAVVETRLGKRVRYQIPSDFWKLTTERKLKYIANEGPPIDTSLLNSLSDFFTGTDISIRSYQSRYHPLKPRKLW